mgnify:CR=1 FL=1
MKKIISFIRENRELIITNIILSILTITEAVMAICKHNIISGVIAIAAFMIACILFKLFPYGEECIAAITSLANAIGFGLAMFYKPERVYFAYIALVFVIIGFTFQMVLSQNRADGRL